MRAEVDVVVLAYGPEPLLAECVASIMRSKDVSPQVFLVDNGSADVEGLADHPRLHVQRPGHNTGYAGGCNLAAGQGTSRVVAFVNSDVVLEPAALGALVDRLDHEEVGLATGCLLLAGQTEPRPVDGCLDEALVNTVGNPVHWAGFSWCGGYGDRRGDHLHPGAVASISGGMFAVRRETWDHLGGFEAGFFAYHEDVDLSLRCWISGKSVVYEPRAVGWHAYEFSRNPGKTYLVERNRLLTWLTVPSARTWRRICVSFAVVQLMAFGKAMLSGDGLRWLRASCWVLSHPRYVYRRRLSVQRRRTRPDDVWLSLAASRLEPPGATGVAVPNWVNTFLDRLSPRVGTAGSR